MSAGSAGQTSEPPPARARSVRWQWVVVLGAVLLMVPALVALWFEYRIKWWIEEVRLADGSVIELHRRTEFHKVGEWALREWATKRERIRFDNRGIRYEVHLGAEARYLDRCGEAFCLVAESGAGYACFRLSEQGSQRVRCQHFPVADVRPNLLVHPGPGAALSSELRFPEKSYLMAQEQVYLKTPSPWPVPELMSKSPTWGE